MSKYDVTLDLMGIEADSLEEAEARAARLLDNLGKEYDIWDVWEPTE